ncbi:MAG: tetratricopeptide repeat protein [Thermoanaerobaculia bacterium]
MGRRLIFAVAFFSLPIAPAFTAGSSTLPPIACVEAVRNARIAGDKGDALAERQKLAVAVDLPGCELPALSRLVPLLRASADAPEHFAALRDRLVSRLRDPATEIPLGLLTQLVAARSEPEDDSLLLAALEARQASAPVPASASGAERIEELQAEAELQQRLGKKDAARESFGRLLVLAPTDGLRWRVLFLDVDAGRWESADRLLVPMIASPDAPEYLRYLHAAALANLGRLDDLLQLLDQLAPPPPPPMPLIPPQDRATGTAADGVIPPDVLASALHPERDRAGDFAGLLMRTAWALRDAGRDADAAGLFRRALLYWPDSTEAQGALLHLYGTAEERAASAAAAATRREQETDPQRLFEEGSDLLGAGDAAGARELLARAAPGLAGSGYAEPAWYNLATANFKLERWADAAASFAEAIAVNPERLESHWKRAIALFRLERCGEAVPVLQSVLERDPSKNDAHYYLAGCYSRLGDTLAAKRESALFNAVKPKP